MTTAAKSAFGTKLYRGGAGTPKTGGQLIEECDVVEPPESTDAEIKVTSHDSTDQEYILQGCVDAGEMNVSMNYKAGTGQELLRGDLGGAAQGYYINLPGGAGQKQLDFLALVKRFKLGSPIDGKVAAEITMRITGPVTWTNQ